MSATPRSLEDARAKQALLAQYVTECERIESFRSIYLKSPGDENCVLIEDLADFAIKAGEYLEVFERRRDKLENALKNAGIKLHADATESLPSITREQQRIDQA